MTESPTAADYAAGLRRLADMIEANPNIRPVYLHNPNVWCPTGPDEVQAIIRAGLAAGADIVKHDSDVQRNVGVRFGVVEAMALVSKAEVCERVVVGTETVMVPDPEWVPPQTPMVEQVREITEWRCRPLMRDHEADR